LWVHPSDAEKLGLENGGLARVSTRIGYFIPRVWVTEGIHPGIVACSHHVGRWRLNPQAAGDHQSAALVELFRKEDHFLFRKNQGVRPFKSKDEDTEQIWWSEVGVNQNMTFPVQPDPVSGMHCWHQRVFVRPASGGEHYGDIMVDTTKAAMVYDEWLKKTRPAPGPDGLRRPLWLNRPLHPTPDAYKM
jgi:hypothetical protein